MHVLSNKVYDWSLTRLVSGSLGVESARRLVGQKQDGGEADEPEREQHEEDQQLFPLSNRHLDWNEWA